MRDRSKSTAGRGFQRSEWTQYHNRLVQIPDKVGGSTRNEKVIKLTELLQKREINTKQIQTKVADSTDSNDKYH